MEFNLADLWETVVDTVPDREALVCGDRRLTYAEPTSVSNRSPTSRRPRHRPRRPRRALPLQRHRVPRGHARRVQAARGPDQRELPLRRGRAALPARRRRRQGGRLPPRVRAEARRDPRPALPRCTRYIAVDDGSRDATSTPLDAVEYEAALARRVAGARLRAALGRRPLHPLHRRHHRHAEGRDVAPRGHLLRRARRRRHRRAPITAPEEIAERAAVAAARAACPACPFMHGTAHWMALRDALHAAAPSSSRPTADFDPRALWRARRARAGQLPRDRRRRVRAAARRRARRPRRRRVDLSSLHVVLLSGGAILSPTVKRELGRDAARARSSSTAIGSSETGGQGQIGRRRRRRDPRRSRASS